MTKIFKTLIFVFLLVTLAGCNTSNELKLHLISDVHYAPSELFEYTGNFAYSNDNNGTGKQIKYQEEIIDAFINQEIDYKPDYIIVTGDLTFSGSYQAHKEFADKFHNLLDNNIKVLIIPGNHDFDYIPFTYYEDVIHYDNKIQRDDFISLYKEYGYEDADSIDNDSLSYSYQLDKQTYLIALDTLSNYGDSFGKLKDETLKWVENRMQYASDKKMNILVVGHHNIFVHNSLFDQGYRIDNSEKLINLMKQYNAHLYVSGHMHIQSIKNSDGIDEILNESFALYPHRFGELIINNHNYSYSSLTTDVEKYTVSTNKDMLNYKEYGYNFLFNNFYSQVLNNYQGIDNNEDLNSLLKNIAEINALYFMGDTISDDKIKDIDDNPYKDLLSNYLQSIIKYSKNNNLSLTGSLR